MNALRLLGALLLTAVLSACSSTGPAAPSCSETQPYEGAPRRSAPDFVWERDFSRSVEGAVDPSLAAKLEAALDSLLSYYPAISAAVALPGRGTWAAARGVVRAGTSAAVSDTSLFQVASVSKAFTAAVVLQLVEEGRLSLEAPVAQWFPDVPNADVITVAQLLDHTSGLVSFNALPDGDRLEPNTYLSPEELVEIASEYDPHFCPGAEWSYTNTGYVVLGRIVEAVEGQPFGDVLATRMLDPLGLNHTVMRKPGVEVPAVVSGHASGTPLVEPGDGYATPYTAGALASTAVDLVRFWHGLLSGEVLPPSMVRGSFEQMYPMQPLFPAPPGTEMFYGRGVQLTDAPGGQDGPGPMLEHSGGIAGFNAVVAYLAEDDAYVAIVVNDEDVPAAAGLWRLVQTLRANRSSRGP